MDDFDFAAEVGAALGDNAEPAAVAGQGSSSSSSSWAGSGSTPQGSPSPSAAAPKKKRKRKQKKSPGAKAKRSRSKKGSKGGATPQDSDQEAESESDDDKPDEPKDTQTATRAVVDKLAFLQQRKGDKEQKENGRKIKYVVLPVCGFCLLLPVWFVWCTTNAHTIFAQRPGEAVYQSTKRAVLQLHSLFIPPLECEEGMERVCNMTHDRRRFPSRLGCGPACATHQWQHKKRKRQSGHRYWRHREDFCRGSR